MDPEARPAPQPMPHAWIGEGGLDERGRGQKQDGKKQRAHGRGHQSGQNTTGAALPEIRQSKTPFAQIAPGRSVQFSVKATF